MVELMEGLPAGVVGIRGVGTVTGTDYETVVIPAVEAAVREHGSVRVLYDLGEGFDGFTPAAMWDDAKVGMAHLNRFERVAVVSDGTWIRGTVRALAFLIPGQVRVFESNEAQRAREWITA